MAQSKDKLLLLTLNTHSWQEADNASCLRHVAEGIAAEQPDVIALQEVNQKEDAAPTEKERLAASGYAGGEFTVGADNWQLLLCEELGKRGLSYHWTWMFAHLGYRTWSEGLTLMTKAPITEIRWAELTPLDLQPGRWVRRRALAVRTERGWFCSTHMGWWGDPIDPFRNQWEKLTAFTDTLDGSVWVMGDFNCPAHVRGEGYELVTSSGWQDCYARAKQRDSGITIPGQIDGWRNQEVDGFRLDYCFARQAGVTLSSRVMFNGCFHPAVSDHFGVLTEEEM